MHDPHIPALVKSPSLHSLQQEPPKPFSELAILSHSSPSTQHLAGPGLRSRQGTALTTRGSGFQRNLQLQQRSDLGIYLSWALLKILIRAQLWSKKISYAKNSACRRVWCKSLLLEGSCESAPFKDKRKFVQLAKQEIQKEPKGVARASFGEGSLAVKIPAASTTPKI